MHRLHIKSADLVLFHLGGDLLVGEVEELVPEHETLIVRAGDRRVFVHETAVHIVQSA